jgi:hypothetical protein
MKFPSWAPEDLVDFYLNELLPADSIYDDHKSIVLRLITRPEMEKVWAWFDEQKHLIPPSANGGVVGSLLRHYDLFKNTVKTTKSQRKEDLLEIKALSNRLKVLIHKYKDEPFLGLSDFNKLISHDYDLPLIQNLSDDAQEYLKQIKTKWNRDFPYWNQTLPPLTDLLKGIAENADRESQNERFDHNLPTKINQSSALKTYMINCVLDQGRLYGAMGALSAGGSDYYPNYVVQIIVSVAFEIDDITPDDVRKLITKKKAASS